MKIGDLKDELNEEVSTIMSSAFSVSVTKTNTVPHSDDAAITFPNLDEYKQSCKLIDTCILYIDIRRSTELNLSHKPQTVAKLYSAFVRAMTKAARHYNGHVRGIIGDRVMVLFDCENAFLNAMRCAILMNSVSKHVVNRHFKANEVSCGIGIDSGKMLVTKTGIRKNGQQRNNYKNLVWLGRPANVASKLTDLANKKGEGFSLDVVNAAFQTSSGLDDFKWRWQTVKPWDFINHIEMSSTGSNALRHKDSRFRSFFISSDWTSLKEETPPILMSRAVFDGFKSAKPDLDGNKVEWFREVKVEVPGFSDKVFGCDIIYTTFKE